jgi:hypothetical protein
MSSPDQLFCASTLAKPGRPELFTPHCTKPLDFTPSSVWAAPASPAGNAAVARAAAPARSALVIRMVPVPPSVLPPPPRAQARSAARVMAGFMARREAAGNLPARGVQRRPAVVGAPAEMHRRGPGADAGVLA